MKDVHTIAEKQHVMNWLHDVGIAIQYSFQEKQGYVPGVS